MKSAASSTRWTNVPTCSPTGMAASSDGTVEPGGLAASVGGSRRRRPRRRGSSCEQLLLGLARDARVVGARGDVAVGRAPPAHGRARGRTRAGDEVDAAVGAGASTAPAARAASARPRCSPAPAPRAPRSARRPCASVGVAVARRRHVAVVAAREQQPAERRVAAVPRARPPDDGLVLRPGQRDVGQAQVLAALLLLVLRGGGAPKSGPSRPTSIVRTSPCAGSWKKTGSIVARDVARLPQVRAVDDRELEALAAVDRQHLHRLGVGLQAPAALLVARSRARPRRSAGAATAVSAVAPSCSAVAAACSSWPTWRRSVRSALAVGPGQHAAGQPLGARDRLEQRGDAAAAQHPRPAVQAAVDVLPLRRRRPRATRSAVQPRNGVSAAERARVRRGGPLERLEQRAASRAPATVAKTLPAPLMTAGCRPRRARRARARRCGGCARARRRGPGGRLAARRRAVVGARSRPARPTTAGSTRSAARSCAMCSRADGALA